MVSDAAARDRFYRTIQPILGDEASEFLMDALAPMEWGEVATKADLRALGGELRAEVAGLRADVAEFRSEMRAEMVSKTELAEQLRLHVDARVGDLGSAWMFSVMGMQAATIAGVIAAVRL